MNIYLTSPSFTAAAELMYALADQGVQSKTVEWNKQPHADPEASDRWVMIVPAGLEVDMEDEHAQAEDAMVVDLDTPIAAQVDLVLRALRWKGPQE